MCYQCYAVAQELIATLQETEVHFVRCMKPNLLQAPRCFAAQYVRTRVRAAGSPARRYSLQT